MNSLSGGCRLPQLGRCRPAPSLPGSRSCFQGQCSQRRTARLQPPRAAAELAEVATAASAYVQSAVDALVVATPEAAQPLVAMLGRDVAGLVGLNLTLEGTGRLLVLYYFLFTRPGPLVGLLDFYAVGPLTKLLQKKYTVNDFTLRDRLGSGNYGQVFEGLRNSKDGVPDLLTRELTPDQKKRRVVLKKTNLDNTGIRTNFLTVGTMARGAQESGQVEAYMCTRISLHPLVRPWAAEYLGSFTAQSSARGFTTGTQWLVWKFESDSTLSDAIAGGLGPFPGALAGIMLGQGRARSLAPADEEDDKRDSLVVKAIMRKLLTSMERLHSLGIVHRDIKPDNIMVTADGDVKLIDFGAACDLSTGINYNPLYGMLDPRYAAPEELVMPKTTPRAPLPVLASLFAPFIWSYGRPDLFDTYAAGIILLQLSVPQLANPTVQRQFNLELANCEYNLDYWRNTSPKARQLDFSLLDRNGGAGWDLACKLVCERNSFNRGRLSAVEALRHRYFLVPEF